ncbi:hypothetical protein ACQ86K_22080 [Mucilaginibacter sp. P19]|uniref:Uncharacterized protein n=1 Tax=Mucilaginibacter gossypii TaxID=551996 RepID=A0A1G8JFY8_9SPHI|nr:hypothetical protein SAMN05192573_118104 [Mucilaginibacter gossypii]
MKHLSILFVILLISACTHPQKRKKVNSLINIVKADNTSPSINDTINISTVKTDTIKYSKKELKRILYYNSELGNKIPLSPDATYNEGPLSNRPNDTSYINYGSENGMDNYYLLYAYFLMLKTGKEKYADQREKLIKMYQDINFIYEQLAGGGTYFDHQQARIFGYAEYSVYKYKYHEENKDFKKYNVVKQKQLYIKLLKQHIDDELNAIFFTGEETQKLKLKKALTEKADDIDHLITGYFYLEEAQEFQNSKYY